MSAYFFKNTLKYFENLGGKGGEWEGGGDGGGVVNQCISKG